MRRRSGFVDVVPCDSSEEVARRGERHLMPLVVPDDICGLRRDLPWEPRLDRRLPAVEVRAGRE